MELFWKLIGMGCREVGSEGDNVHVAVPKAETPINVEEVGGYEYQVLMTLGLIKKWPGENGKGLQFNGIYGYVNDQVKRALDRMKRGA